MAQLTALQRRTLRIFSARNRIHRGGPSPFLSETAAVVAAMEANGAPVPSEAIQLKIDTLFLALKTGATSAVDILADHIDHLGIYVAHSEFAQFVEWKSATVLGGRIGATPPPFITTGIAANNIGCVNTGFNPNDGTLFTLDDCGFMTYYSTNIEEASIDGGNDNTSAIRFQHRIATNSTAGNVNAAIATDTFTGTDITDGSGLSGIGRALSSATQTVWNQDIEAQTSAETSTATPDVEMYVLGRNNNGTIADVSTANKILAFVAVGAWDASAATRLKVVVDINAAIAAFVA